jgi:hypothetical protein
MESPQQFNADIYEEVRAIIRANAHIMAPEAELALAQIAGGDMLRAATSLLEFPPCPSSGQCIDCWVQKWCIHTKTPVNVRIALINALGTFTTPDLKMPKSVVEKIKAYDKTNPNDVGVLLAIAKHYRTQQEQEEKAKNDKAEDSK